MAKKYQPDPTDLKILDILKDNARIQWREIGEEVHMTGQAVGERVRRMMKHGIIKGFRTVLDEEFFDPDRVDYITVIMHSNDHDGFLKMVNGNPQVKECYKISGHGCYMMKVESDSQESLDGLLNDIVVFANYQINSVIKKHK